jgi:hypothetical protein
MAKDLQEVWKKRIIEFQASGLSRAAWCNSRKFSLRQLSYWINKEAKNSEKTAASKKAWLPVEINNQAEFIDDNALVVKIGQAAIEVKPGFNPKLLFEILKTLKTLC